jgi:nucleoid-associated protein YgaU
MKQVLAITCTILAIMLGFNEVKNAQSFDCDGPTTVIATHGDTMWAIAQRYCTGHVGNATHNIIQLNGNTSQLQPGQVIFLPERK